ncbi:MAG: septal ring lytic transglycosylase RlpA family protein, partial [Rhodospirillaceae bacterium]
HGRRTANGEVYDMNALTAAHRTLPMPSYVRVTNLENGRSLVLKVNDRGPFAKGRIIDISRRGSQLLGFQNKGTAKVRVQILVDKSRALAVRLKNQDELAKVGSPITVKRLPKAKVNAESLPPPPGATGNAALTQAPEPAPAPPPPTQVAQATPAAQPVTVAPQAPKAPSARSPVTGKVSQRKVGATNIYVQAGAFGEYANANRVQARLSSVGPVKISSILVNGRDLYRVRVGPLASVDAADVMLERVAQAGYSGAKIIVE